MPAERPVASPANPHDPEPGAGGEEPGFRALWEASPLPQLLLDAEGRVLLRNHAAEPLGPGETLAALLRDPGSAAALLGAPGSAVEQPVELWDGRRVLLSCSPVAAEGGPPRVLVALRDISVWRRLEQELEATRAAASLGQLALAVASEINNPLAVLLGRIELIGAVGGAEGPAIAPHLDILAQHARQIADILQGLQALGRVGTAGCAEHPLEPLLDRARQLAGRRLGAVVIAQEFAEPGLGVVGDREQLAQALCALLIHCAGAMHRRGTVQVRAWAEQERTRVAVQDYGTAPPRGVAELLGRQHAPMELLAAGVGLGLLLAHVITREQGGWLTVQTDGVRGARYLLDLPGRRSALDEDLPRVLVIDPTGTLGPQVHAALVGVPVGVRVVSTGQEATRVLEGCRVALVLVPQELPGQTGLTLRRGLVRRWPELEPRVHVLHAPPGAGIPGVPTLPDPPRREALLAALGVGGPTQG